MIRVNVTEAKTNFSKYLAMAKQGETIVICKGNVPIAEIRGIPLPQTEKRPVGLFKGLFAVPDDFNAPMSAAELEEWYGPSD